MKRFILVLLILLLPVCICSFWVTQDFYFDGSQQGLTEEANLWALDSWSEEDELLGVRIDHTPSDTTEQAEAEWVAEPEWVAVNVEDGALASGEAPVHVQASEAVKVTVEGTTHRLEYKGQTIWETDEEILGRPALSPDESWLVLSRIPRGNQTSRLGELWRYELSSGEWMRLTENGMEESSPLISADGLQVAFLRDGDVWTIPANETTREELVEADEDQEQEAIFTTRNVEQSASNLVAPATIRVIHVAAENACRPSVRDGEIHEIPFEQYVKRVVPHETPSTWHSEALKAQAVASRTYAWRLVAENPNAQWHVTDTTDHQYMCDVLYSSTNAAVDATRGEHLTYSGRLITALFSAENSSATFQNRWGHLYLSAVDDPISFGQKRKGHGQGYSQWGGKRWADLGWSYRQILGHYYTGARLSPPAGDITSLLDVSNRPTSPYLRGSALWVELNANHVAQTMARDWSKDQNGQWRTSAWQTDSDGSNGWGHLFPINHLNDLPEKDYRVEYQYTTRREVQAESAVPVLFLGIDRTPPSLEALVTLQNTPVGRTVYFSIKSSDELSGLERVGWSTNESNQEAELISSGLPVVADQAASGKSALQLHPTQTRGPQNLTFGNYQVPPDHYRVWFRLRTNQIGTATKVATLRLFDEAEEPLQRGVRYLRGADFPSSDWTWFFVDIDMTTNYAACPTEQNPENPCRTITPIVDWHGTQPLEIDEVFLATRPSTILNQATISIKPPKTITLYATDHAENVTFTKYNIYPSTNPVPDPYYKIYLPLVSNRSQ
ncbi:MAG: SpoIID/LytB domain-containing protein [Ardenticatenaceae bacterium]